MGVEASLAGALHPFVLFQLRGKTREEVLAGLRETIGEWELESGNGQPAGALPASFCTGHMDPIPAGLMRPSTVAPVLSRLGPIPLRAQEPVLNALRVAAANAGERLARLLPPEEDPDATG